MQAANLVEARRLKKEARAKAKAKRPPDADPAVHASSASVTKDETTPSPTDIIARALGRWGASLGANPGKELTEGLHGERVSADAEAASANPFPRLWTAGVSEDSERLGSAEPKAIEMNCESKTESRTAARDCGAAAAAFDSVLDCAAEVLPLPAQSNAEALITDLLPSLPRNCMSQLDGTLQDANTGQDEVAGASRVTNEEPHMPFPASSSAGQQGRISEFELVPDVRETTTFHEFSLEQAATAPTSDAVRQGSFRRSNGTHGEGASPWEASQEGDIWCAAVSAPLSPEAVEQAFALHGDTRSNGGCEQLSDLPWRAANNTRTLEALRAKDWRARRVSRAAVEIDMSLPRDDVAGSGSTIHLHLDPSSNSSTDEVPAQTAMNLKPPRQRTTGRQALPDLSTVLEASKRPHTCIKQASRATHQPRAGAGLLIDEETLAAEELRRNRRPIPSSPPGTLEIRMQRCFDQKWRRELLPIGASRHHFACLAARGSASRASSRLLPALWP